MQFIIDAVASLIFMILVVLLQSRDVTKKPLKQKPSPMEVFVLCFSGQLIVCLDN